MTDIERAIATIGLAGFAVQRSLEILDAPIDLWSKKKAADGTATVDPVTKKIWTAAISFVIGLLIGCVPELRVLQYVYQGVNWIVDQIVTGLIISAGTEGANSIIKFLTYAKDARKAEAELKKQEIVMIAELTFSPSPVKGGSTVLGAVTLSNPAGNDGVTISLTSSDKAATPPATAHIGPGQRTTVFSIQTQVVLTSTPVAIAASAAGSIRVGTLQIT
jgi:hypothetical protein